MTDLDDVLIGGREKREIAIAEYDPAWPERYARERARILGALGSRALRVEHVGSTSVPGLAAKPIVDVLVAVADPEDGSVVSALEGAGYVLRVREPGHRMVRTPELDVHVHVWRDGDAEIARVLALRDTLRGSASDRAAYEQLKRELARREWDDMNDYAAAKGSLIEAILKRTGRNTLVVRDRGLTLEFSFEDLMRYHGPRSPGGVAHAYKVMERAFAELGRVPERREVSVRTAFGGPGARDAFELVLRAVTANRYVVDASLARPELGRERERFVFEVAGLTLVLRDGFVVPEFIDLARAEHRSRDDEARLDVLKREMADRVMSAPASDVYDLA